MLMTTVTIVESESTSMGDMAELILDKSIVPSTGMILMDEDSQTWEVTGALHDAKRTTGDDLSTKRWTLRCKPVNTDQPIHTGEFKLIH
jgi:hypothetical protein